MTEYQEYGAPGRRRSAVRAQHRLPAMLIKRAGVREWPKIENMAHPAGLEPATPRFEAWYSIQLNYRCAVSREDSLEGAECCTSLDAHARARQQFLSVLLTS